MPRSGRRDESAQVNGPDVVAAGAVVLDGRGRVLLVHRPKYDDWSFPKGKQEPGEHVTVTAVREVLEETGVEIRLGRPLMPQVYAVAGGRAKTVHYWVGHVVGDADVSGYEANSEVDSLGWFTPDKALEQLSYLDDVQLLEEVRKTRTASRTLVVLRHARARKRKSWDKADVERPLTDVGRAQSLALSGVLAAYGVTRVVTSAAARCAQTVAPYSEEHVLGLEARTDLTEEEHTDAAVGAVVAELLEGGENAVLCTHRPVLPEVLAALEIEEEPLSPAEMIVIHHRKGHARSVERHLVR